MPEDLLQRVARGDADSVRLVIDRYAGLVWSLARRLAGSQADAEDAVQEIFLDVWKSAGRFDPAVAAEATFVAMIARRRLIDRRRRAGRRPEAPMDGQDLAVSAPVQARTVELSEDAKLAAGALEALRPEQQQVLRMSVLMGMSHERIAETTGLPLGTVKTHVRRGLIRIRELLEQPRTRGGTGVTS